MPATAAASIATATAWVANRVTRTGSIRTAILVLGGIFVLVAVAGHQGGGGSIPTSETLAPWPFRISPVTLTCQAGRVFAAGPDGVRYAVNGSARGEAPEMRPIQGYYDTTAAINRGLKLCEDGQASTMVFAPATPPAPAPMAGRAIVEPGELFGGLSLSSTRSDPINGKLPEISASCDEKGKPSFFMGLVQAPGQPPALRGVIATVRFDDEPPQRFEAAWLPEASWSPRDGQEAQELRLAVALARARRVTVDGLRPYAPTPISWTIDLSEADRARFIRQCRG